MTDETCGHPTADDEPCQLPASYPDDLCHHHTDIDGPEDAGRPTKLTKERQERIAGAIEEGKSMTSAARMAGVSRNAVYEWIEKGGDQDEGVYAEFHDRIARAKGHGEDRYFTLAMQLAKENGDHRFIASLMKKRYPESWAKTETGVEAGEIVVYDKAPDKEELERLLRPDDE